MDINLSVSPAPGILSNYLVIAIYKASAPNNPVSFQYLAAPHVDSQNITFTNVDNAVYIVITYENSDNVPGGTIRHSFIYNPGSKSAQIRTDLVLIAGSGTNAPNPTPGASTFTRADLAGWTYSVERRGFGTMAPGLDITFSPDGTTWTLFAVGDVFAANEIFIVRFQPQITISSAPVSQSAGVLFADTLVKTASGRLQASDFGNFILIQSDTNTITLTFDDFSTIPDNKLIALISEGGSHINAVIKCQANQFINIMGTDNNEIYLGQSEHAWMYKYNGKIRVSHADGNFKTVGEIVHHFKYQDNGLLTGELNTVFANGLELSRAVYPRLWKWVSQLDISDLVSDGVWNTPDASGKFINKGKFSTGNGTTTFRIPLLYVTTGISPVDNTTVIPVTAGMLKGVDYTNKKSGRFESATYKPFWNTLDAGGAETVILKRDGHGTTTQVDDINGNTEPNILKGVRIDTTLFSNELTPDNIGVYLLIRS